MKHHAVVFCSAALVVMLTGCSETAAILTPEADIKALKDNEVQWNKDYESRDPAKVAAHYADDAVLMNPGMPASKGKAAIQKTLTDMLMDPALTLKFQADRVEVTGNMAYTQGAYQMTMTDPATRKPMNDHGSYVTIYKKQGDGSWKAVQDAAISEVPPPAPAPAKKK
ncbi:MAG: SgcJ/EcaC family oxidoreductase [Acidobacteriia bacterium]|nr:SgcJ/EcaC family oxidoreductase [Terriglobia bacterium]